MSKRKTDNSSSHSDDDAQTLAEELSEEVGNVVESDVSWTDVRLRQVFSRSETDPQARMIASGLNLSVSELTSAIAGEEAAGDRGRLFYFLKLGGARLAIRWDALRAYVVWDEDVRDDVGVAAMLAECNLHVDEALDLAATKSREDNPWILVAEGDEPTAANSEQVEFQRLGNRDLELGVLRVLSTHLDGIFSEEVLDPLLFEQIEAIAVRANETIATVSLVGHGEPGRDIFGREIQPPVEAQGSRLEVGTNVICTAEGEFRATCYGYLCVLGDQLSVVPPFWIAPEYMEAFWVVLDTHPHSVTREMVDQCLDQLEIRAGELDGEIDELIKAVASDNIQRGSYPIARGRPAEHQEESQFQFFVDTDPRVGTKREDGSIDFHEINYTPNATFGQRVVCRTPGAQGSHGFNVKGEPLVMKQIAEKPVVAGENIRLALEDGVDNYYAEADGMLRMSEDSISIVELLVVDGDVEFSTGNLKFVGQIFVKGSVIQGFSVKAGESITIGGTVEPGATVMSKADITVGKGIVGRRTKVRAGGDLRAQFVQEADVRVVGDIQLGNYAYHASLRAGGSVTVLKGKGGRSGSVIGGQTWARALLESHTAGARNGTETVLVAGVLPEQAQELDRVDRSLVATGAHIEQILERLGLERLDVGRLRSMMKGATGAHKNLLARRAKQLGELAKAHQDLMDNRRELLAGQGPAAELAEIRILGHVYPGTTIRIGEHQQKLVGLITAPRFHLKDDKIVER